MKKLSVFLLTLILCMSLNSCAFDDINPQKIVDKFDSFAEFLSRSQITDDKYLIGKRTCKENNYAGEYSSDCSFATGKDVIFGGASVYNRKIKIYGKIKTENGYADVRVRTGSTVSIIKSDKDGNFKETFNFDGGGNYIMIDYNNFSGEIELFSEENMSE